MMKIASLQEHEQALTCVPSNLFSLKETLKCLFVLVKTIHSSTHVCVLSVFKRALIFVLFRHQIPLIHLNTAEFSYF